MVYDYEFNNFISDLNTKLKTFVIYHSDIDQIKGTVFKSIFIGGGD